MLLFFKWFFYELANPLYLWISGAEIVWFIGIFLCLLVRNVFCTVVRTPDLRVQTCRPVCAIRVDELWCKLLEKCLKLCSMKFRSSLGSILQQKQNYLQGSYTDLEFNTWPLPKKVGSLIFHTIRVLYFWYVQRIINYSVLTQAVPRNNLIKISHSQVYIFIFFFTYLSG